MKVCYTPEMRKWMRERLTRRKKGTEKAAGEPTPAPLQPAFYDTEVASPAPRMAEDHKEDHAEDHGEREVSEPQPRSAPEAQPGQERTGGDADASRRRRRRGRGGRGRSGRASQPPKVAEGVVPAAAAPVASAVAGGTAPAAAPRPPKGTVVLAVGLPGSGKSSWFKRNNITPLVERSAASVAV